MKITAVFISLLGILLLGCGEQGVAPDPQQNKPEAQEVPQEVQSLLNQYAINEYNMPEQVEFPASDWTTPSLTDTSYEIYVVTFIWGHLFNSGSVGGTMTTTDWSGSLSVNGVAYVGIAGNIDFEPGEDSLVPTNVPSMAAWSSHTSSDFDGIISFVFLKKGIVYITAPVLTFATEPFTISYHFEELVDFSALYNVDNINSVAVLSRRVWPPQCPQGLLIGEWTKVDIAGDSGHFNGTWLDDNNLPGGVFAGSFWKTSDNERVFEGTISGYWLTVVIGYMRGIWYYDDPRDCMLCGSGHGKFKGFYKMVDPNPHTGGVIEGEFGDYSLPVEQLNMPLNGTWKQFCPHFDEESLPFD